MKDAPKVTTRFPVATDLEPRRVARLSELINEVYDEAESGMWKRRGTRTNPAEVQRMLRDRALILAEIDAEAWAREKGCHTMRLELLTPREWTHPSKTFLQRWYARIGYAPHAAEPLEIMHPELVPELATACDFTVWLKPLY